MSAVVKQFKKMTLTDYYRIVGREDEIKYEFFQGVIYAMTGGTPEHSLLGGTIVGILYQQLGVKGPCRVYNSDLHVGHGQHNRADRDKPFRAYPDASIVCGERLMIGEGRETACSNPRIIFEVTSPGTEDYDRELKLDEYIRMDSLMTYVLISHEERCITIHERDDDWMLKEYFEGTIQIPHVEVSLNMDELYFGIKF